MRKFLFNKRGAIAVESALVAPVMVGLFFWLAELALALGAKSDTTNLASVGADLIAQESAASSSDMSNVFNALSAMLFPYPPSNVQITISSVVDSGSSTSGTVDWSCTQGGTARGHGTTYSFPAAAQGVITAGSGGSVIVAEVSYVHSLGFAATIPGVITLPASYTFTNIFYSRPRKVAQITGPTTC